MTRSRSVPVKTIDSKTSISDPENYKKGDNLMKRMKIVVEHIFTLLLLASLMVTFQIVPTKGATLSAFSLDQPEWEMNPLILSKYAVIRTYNVDPALEGDFLDTLTKSSPFEIPYPGFTNERILRPLSTSSSQEGVYFSVGRFLDEESAKRVETQKDRSLAQMNIRGKSALNPTVQVVRLVEHLLGDWGWEHKTAQKTVIITADSGSPKLLSNVLTEKISSVAFFKIGYTGQVGVLEFSPKGMDLNELKKSLQTREALSGASIYETKDRQFVVYSEYFVTPRSFANQGFKSSGDGYTGLQAGRVIQNYTTK
jgi:hypothetical protein